MRNLKRALSLALAAVMLIGMMAVGAGAVDSYNDFTDKDEIVNKDAVSMLVTLGVIDGKEDGSYFDPTGNVTRAEMAKMISVIMNQGADVNALYDGMSSGLTDVANSWAKGHINFCYSQKIIAGRGDGRFAPTENVTAAEAAKMLLVAAGYDPKIEGFEGADWAINTSARASKLGIYRNFTKNTMEPLSRDDAALLIYNAMDVEMIQKYEDGYAINWEDHRTILSYMYGVYKVEGVVVANQWAQLQETGSEAALRAGKTTLEDVIVYTSTTANTTTGEGVREREPITFNVDTKAELLGKTVTLFIEKTTILSNSKVLGVSLKDDVNVIQASTATEKKLADYLKGTGVTTDRSTGFYVNYGFCEDGTTEAVALINESPNRDLGETNEYFNVNGVSIEVIDNDDDGIAEYVLYLQETLSEVNRYNDKAETITFYQPARDSKDVLTGQARTVSRDFEDVVFVDEVTTDDLILYVEYGGRTYVSLPEIVSGLMTRVDRDKDSELYITVEGETYKQSYIPDAASMVDVELTHFDIDDARSNDMVGFDNEYDFILDSTGAYVVAVRPAEKIVTNYALVVGSAWTQNALDRSGQVKILKTDGTTATYTLNWNKSRDALKDVVSINGSAQYDSTGDGNVDVGSDVVDLTKDQKLELYLGTRDVNMTSQVGYAEIDSAVGSVITYSLSSDDRLTIQSVMQGNTWVDTAGHDDLEIDNTVNPKDSAGVADNGIILYLGTNAGNDNLQYNLNAAYSNGDGSIRVRGVDDSGAGAAKVNSTTGIDKDGESKTYAVDLNTVGFYYWLDGTDTKYGVAVGWDNMSNVAVDTDAQVYPVLEKAQNRTYRDTNLAEVILFESAVSANTADYALVLNANAKTKDTWALTVVFEDGTVDEITVDDDDLGGFDPDDADCFMQAWSYSTNADGTYKIGTKTGNKGHAYLLKNGTVDFTDTDGIAPDATGYIALSGKADVWDVTDVESENDSTVSSAFTKTRVNAVLIIEKDAIRAAWIWDRDDVNPDLDDTNPIATEVTEIDPDNLTIHMVAFRGAKNRVAVAHAALVEAGYTDAKLTGTTGAAPNTEYQFETTDKHGLVITFTTDTTWYNDGVVGAIDANSGSLTKADLVPGDAVTGSAADMTTLFGAAAGWTAGEDHLAFVYKTNATTSGAPVFTIEDRNGNVVYTETLTTVASTRYIAYVTIDSTSNAGAASGIWTVGDPLPNGNYAWSVVDGTTTLASGTFTLNR